MTQISVVFNAQEYNYVKSILRTAAGKQLKHLVLIGGDADCKSLLEAAQADGVQCEMMYQPMAVGSSYLRGKFCSLTASRSLRQRRQMVCNVR